MEPTNWAERKNRRGAEIKARVNFIDIRIKHRKMNSLERYSNTEKEAIKISVKGLTDRFYCCE